LHLRAVLVRGQTTDLTVPPAVLSSVRSAAPRLPFPLAPRRLGHPLFVRLCIIEAVSLLVPPSLPP